MLRGLILIAPIMSLYACTIDRQDRLDDMRYNDGNIRIEPAAYGPSPSPSFVRNVVWMYDHGMNKHGGAMQTIIRVHCLSRNPFNKRMRKDLPYCIRTDK